MAYYRNIQHTLYPEHPGRQPLPQSQCRLRFKCLPEMCMTLVDIHRVSDDCTITTETCMTPVLFDEPRWMCLDKYAKLGWKSCKDRAPTPFPRNLYLDDFDSDEEVEVELDDDEQAQAPTAAVTTSVAIAAPATTDAAKADLLLGKPKRKFSMRSFTSYASRTSSSGSGSSRSHSNSDSSSSRLSRISSFSSSIREKVQEFLGRK